MSTSIFHEETTTLRCIKVQCSMNERRAYEERSVFFVHPFFNGESEWPMKTHVVCRYDGEPFDSIPIPLPIGFNEEKNIYTCYGIFCSAACVKAFMENNPVYSNALSMMWLKKIMCEVFGDFDDIVEAPPIELLNKHGGNLDIDQFRKFGKQKTRILTHRLPFFTCSLAFELVKEHAKKIDKGGDFKSVDGIQKPQIQQTQTSHASLKTVKKLQRESNKRLVTVEGDLSKSMSPVSPSPVLPPPILPPHDSPSVSLSTLLPDSIVQVPATSGNRWDIHGLRRPQSQVDVLDRSTVLPAVGTQGMGTQGKSMFQEYLEQRSQKKEPQKQIEPADAKQPQRRRGRPRSTVKPDSPKNPSHGTLVSFLKQ